MANLPDRTADQPWPQVQIGSAAAGSAVMRRGARPLLPILIDQLHATRYNQILCRSCCLVSRSRNERFRRTSQNALNCCVKDLASLSGNLLTSSTYPYPCSSNGRMGKRSHLSTTGNGSCSRRPKVFRL